MKCAIRKTTDFYNILRFFAIVTVVIGHSVYSEWTGDGGAIQLNSKNLSGQYFSLITPVAHIVSWIYGFHMPLFFALSGALYTYSRKIGSINDVLKSKIERLILPYYLVGIFYVFPLNFLAGFYTKETLFPALQTFLFGGLCGHLWFLLALFWCFVLMYFFEKHVARNHLALAGVAICCLFFFNTNMGFSGKKYFAAVPQFSMALNYFPYFFAGYAFEEIRKKKDFFTFWVVIFFLFFLLANIIQYKFIVFNNAIVAILGIGLFYSFSMLLTELDFFQRNRVFNLFLRNCMAIYLFHEPLNRVIFFFANATKMCSTGIGALLYVCLRTLGVTLFSVIIGEFFRKCHKITGNKIFVWIALLWIVLIGIKKII